ncbi:hypothetical protein HDA40_007916 [Hamadaea flava]|uniref:Uncharacterized protein n=1 Tax=Hamadaea flava TaxID=1742688 RepID=A0ABV8LZS6_9ACTN|nr:hypothetical protein [Hamadaea flava]MCP2329409.1 hypothetical protein [Hamadaea flava]
MSVRVPWRHFLVVGLVLCVLAGGAVAGWRADLLWPHIVRTSVSQVSWADRTFTALVGACNSGRYAVDFAGAGRGGDGVALTGTTVDHPHIEARKWAWITLTYQVTDCDATIDGSWPIPLRTRVPAGTFTAWVDGPETTGPRGPARFTPARTRRSTSSPTPTSALRSSPRHWRAIS